MFWYLITPFFFMEPNTNAMLEIGKTLLLELWRILQFARISDSVISWPLYREYLYIPVPGENLNHKRILCAK